MNKVEEKTIPLSVPNLKGNELKYISNALEQEWVSTNGPYVSQFENKIADYLHVCGAVACQSGTAGLHIAMLVSGIKSEEIVIVPTLTFIAAVNPVKYIGATPVFMDCDDSLCLDPIKLKQFCEEECYQRNGELFEKVSEKRIRAVVVVHVFGNMANMEAIMEIAHDYNLIVIEDATEAIGTYYIEGKYKSRFAGTIGDVGVYSFNGNKIITTGGGGMIVSNNDAFLKRARHLTTQAKIDELYYIHDEIGYNYRMTNIQAALGIAQLERLEEFIKIKEENYYEYERRLKGIDKIRLIGFQTEKVRSNHWFYSVFCLSNKINRDYMIQYLIRHHIQCRPIWGLIHEQIPYINEKSYRIEKAKIYWENIINIPCSTNLVKKDIEYVGNILKEICEL